MKGQGPNATVTFYIEAYRGRVWVTCVDCPFTAEAILEPAQAEKLGDLLGRTALEAHRGTKSPTP